MMNHNRPQPRPGPACASVAPLVALVVGQKRLHPEDAGTLQAHLETCAYCRSTLDSYRSLDDTLVRHFAPPARNPLSPDEISAIINQSYQPRPAAPGRQTHLASTRDLRPLAPYRAPRQRRGHTFISALGALAAALLIAVIGLAIFISHVHSPTGNSPPTATAAATLPPISEVPYTPGPKDVLSSIYMVSVDEGWAIGTNFLGAGARDTIILHYTGGQWKQVEGAPDNAQLKADGITLNQVVMVSATEGWAVGGFTSASTQEPFGLILHYTSGRWSVQQTIALGNLTSISITSASNGWAVGSTVLNYQSQQSQSLLLHYDGHSWTSVQAPGQVLLKVAMTSATDGWIIGSTDGTRQEGDLLLRYNGSAWLQTPLPPGMGIISSISPISANDAWAVGYGPGGGGASNAKARLSSFALVVFAHFDGRTWRTVQTPISGQAASITSLFMDASNDGWVVGSIPEGQVSEKMVYLHYTGGKWVEVNGPNAIYLQAVLFMLSASEGWAVGGDNATILHYHNGAWMVALSA